MPFEKPSETSPRPKASLRARLHRPGLIKLLTPIIVAYLAYYLWWRATATLNPDALLFSWVLLLAEGFGVFNYLLFLWMTWDVSPTREYVKPDKGLAVDVYVPTYDEELELLEATLVGCQRMTYPHKTYVLDDGRRPEVEALARLLGGEYITRPDNEHAKAGNINHALTKTSGEFIAVLDADMVPQPDFLERTLGYFQDEQLAFVQAPQEFYNVRDSIQHDRKRDTWHEQALFFRVIQPGKNHSDSAFWAGSPSVMRRKALEDVGGVATETITEDIHTSVRLHAKGWKSLFVNEALAYGIAPQTIHAYLLQRLRWAQGTMQLYRGKESPLWRPGLTPRQRLSYFASFLTYVEAFQKLLLILTPSLIILLHMVPMRVNVWEFVLRWAPYFALTILANQVWGRSYFNYFQTEKFNLLKMVTFLQSFLTLLRPRRLRFRVTPKSLQADVYAKERATLRVYMALLGAIMGISLSGLLQLGRAVRSAVDPGILAIAIVWATYNAGIVLLGIRDVLTHKHNRRQYRFGIELKGNLFSASEKSLIPVELEDLSLNGARFWVNKEEALKEGDLFLYFEAPNQQYLMVPIERVFVRKTKRKDKLVGVQFRELSGSERRRLVELLYVVLPGMLPDRGYEPEAGTGRKPGKRGRGLLEGSSPEGESQEEPVVEVVE